MSWNLTSDELKNVSAQEAHDRVEKNSAPQYIRDYVAAGINGLIMVHGSDVKITITGHGHLCDSPNSLDTTSAVIEVCKASPDKP